MKIWKTDGLTSDWNTNNPASSFKQIYGRSKYIFPRFQHATLVQHAAALYDKVRLGFSLFSLPRFLENYVDK